MSAPRVYLDWNARAPLRPEARAAMLEAMDSIGNPSAVHAEGRAARAIVERARAQVAGLAGCEPDEVVFTSGATEAVAIVARQGWDLAAITGMEHAAVHAGFGPAANPAVADCVVGFGDPANRALPGPAYAAARCWADFAADAPHGPRIVAAATAAEGETGLLTEPGLVLDRLVAPALAARPGAQVLRFSDVTQALGKLPFAFRAARLDAAAASAQKLGGPPGAGALIVREGVVLAPLAPGGGQEGGRRGEPRIWSGSRASERPPRRRGASSRPARMSGCNSLELF
jgi:cysteine desulfurase